MEVPHDILQMIEWQWRGIKLDRIVQVVQDVPSRPERLHSALNDNIELVAPTRKRLVVSSTNSSRHYDIPIYIAHNMR